MTQPLSTVSNTTVPRARRGFAVGMALLVAITPVGGCQTMQDNKNAFLGGVIGAGSVGGACLLARGNPLLCGALAVAGAAAGGAIGHTLDQRDKARRDAALALALQPSVAANELQPNPPVYAENEPLADHSVSAAPAARSHRVVRSPVLASSGRTPKGADTWVNPDGAVQWVNPDTNNSGSVTVLNTVRDPATGQLCRIIDETYNRAASNEHQRERACQQANGTWTMTDAPANRAS